MGRLSASVAHRALMGSTEEVDVVYLQSSPLLPHRVVICPSDGESAAPSIASSSFSPYRGSTAPSLSRYFNAVLNINCNLVFCGYMSVYNI